MESSARSILFCRHEMLQIVSTGQGNLVYDVLKPIVQGMGTIPFSAPNYPA